MKSYLQTSLEVLDFILKHKHLNNLYAYGDWFALTKIDNHFLLNNNDIVFDDFGKIVVEDKMQLTAFCEAKILLNGNKCNLNFLNTSKVKDFSNFFSYGRYPRCFSTFRGRFDEWSFESGEDFSYMFNDNDCFDTHDIILNCPNIKTLEKAFSRSVFSKNIVILSSCEKLTTINTAFQDSQAQSITLDLSSASKLENMKYAFLLHNFSVSKIKDVVFPKDMNSINNILSFIPTKQLPINKDKINYSLQQFLKQMNVDKLGRFLGIKINRFEILESQSFQKITFFINESYFNSSIIEIFLQILRSSLNRNKKTKLDKKLINFFKQVKLDETLKNQKLREIIKELMVEFNKDINAQHNNENIGNTSQIHI